MTQVTILEKAYGSFSTRSFESIITSIVSDLKIKHRVLGAGSRDWIQVEVTGQDEAVAIKIIEKEIGLAPISGEKIEEYSTLSGRVIDNGRFPTELCVDVGIFDPKVCDVHVPLWRLQAMLADGMNVSLQHLVELYCLRDNFPLEVRIVGKSNMESEYLEVELSETQLARFSEWISSNLDRLIVLGANRIEIMQAVERAKHFRDVVRIETLGPLEHAVLCKLGTDAVGLMPKLGPYLRLASLTPFSPAKIKGQITREQL
jgi:hypothetical protein